LDDAEQTLAPNRANQRPESTGPGQVLYRRGVLMAGFPKRFSISAFGPTMINRTKVVDPRRDLGAEVINPMRGALAAVGACLPSAWVTLSFANGGISVAAFGNSWIGGAPPIPNRASAGVYTVTYPATVLDLDGTSVPLAFVGAAANYIGPLN